MSSILPARFQHPYTFNPAYKKPVVYFCMEYALDQAFKIYSGGLGFLAGSHMRSAYEQKQNLIGIGMLWSYGYYDQIRHDDDTLGVQFRRKVYSFLEDTGIKFQITIHSAPVWVKAYYLKPELFGTVPMFFLSTDIAENDVLACSTSHRLYDSNPAAKVAQGMTLGIGGFKLLEELGYEPETYHMNEAHALPLAFQLYEKYGQLDEVKKRLVFTTHTPEEAGNEKHLIHFLEQMSFFGGLSLSKVREITGVKEEVFNHSLVALRMSRLSNAVSSLHGDVSRNMWSMYEGIAPITHITNSQNAKFWVDPELESARMNKDKTGILNRKKDLKREMFKEVADQTGKLFDPDTLTIVWARRFAYYKRPDLITRDFDELKNLLDHPGKPVQVIWAGKPYPLDQQAIDLFNSLVELSRGHNKLAVLTGYELKLSRLLKCGADVWLNTPIVTREASGTSGMTAGMNGALNISTDDGWICEFAQHGKNSFVLPKAPVHFDERHRDEFDRKNFFKVMQEEVLPCYYNKPAKWAELMMQSMKDVHTGFESGRMADEYYKKLY
jgi:glycogen phosphorylase